MLPVRDSAAGVSELPSHRYHVLTHILDHSPSSRTSKGLDGVVFSFLHPRLISLGSEKFDDRDGLAAVNAVGRDGVTIEVGDRFNWRGMGKGSIKGIQ